ncbi:MAG: GatB/YqeY domain-containing protein [Patescibacteria group bacterium]|jgi:hypothetical protein
MSLKDRIEEDYKRVFKEGNANVVSCLRSLKAAIKNAEISAQHDYSDEEVVQVIGTELKKTKESLEAFKKAGRTEQVMILASQCDVLQVYLPEQLSDEELTKAVQDAITQTGASTPADMGKVMGVVMGAVKGRADGNVVKARVQELLNTQSA